MQSAYVPSQDAIFATWLDNLATLIAATPTNYGLVAGDATIISAANTAFQSAYALAINPATRTAPTIANKDAQRAAATATVRPYCVQISLNMGISDALKLGVGVNLPNPARTPIPAPTTSPVMVHVASNPGVASMRYYDTTTPTSKAKPFGAVGLEVRQTIGTAPAVSPDAADYVDTWTKSPNSLNFQSGDVSKIVTVWGRWATKGGPAGVSQKGPWSTAVSFAIV